MALHCIFDQAIIITRMSNNTLYLIQADGCIYASVNYAIIGLDNGLWLKHPVISDHSAD